MDPVPPEVLARAWRVQVEDWGMPRAVAVHGAQLVPRRPISVVTGDPANWIYFQAAACYPCDICTRRISFLEERLHARHYPSHIERRQLDRLLFFVVPLPINIAHHNGFAVVQHLAACFSVEMELLTDYAGDAISLPLSRAQRTESLDFEWDPLRVATLLIAPANTEKATLQMRPDAPADMWAGAETMARLTDGRCGVRDARAHADLPAATP
jgi:hypothetical protein